MGLITIFSIFHRRFPSDWERNQYKKHLFVLNLEIEEAKGASFQLVCSWGNCPLCLYFHWVWHRRVQTYVQTGVGRRSLGYPAEKAAEPWGSHSEPAPLLPATCPTPLPPHAGKGESYWWGGVARKRLTGSSGVWKSMLSAREKVLNLWSFPLPLTPHISPTSLFSYQPKILPGLR